MGHCTCIKYCTTKMKKLISGYMLHFSLYTRTVGGEIQQHYIPSLRSDFDLSCCNTSLHLSVSSEGCLVCCCCVSLSVSVKNVTKLPSILFMINMWHAQERRTYACCFWTRSQIVLAYAASIFLCNSFRGRRVMVSVVCKISVSQLLGHHCPSETQITKLSSYVLSNFKFFLSLSSSNLLRLAMYSGYQLHGWFTYSMLLLFLSTAGFWVIIMAELLFSPFVGKMCQWLNFLETLVVSELLHKFTLPIFPTNADGKVK